MSEVDSNGPLTMDRWGMIEDDLFMDCLLEHRYKGSFVYDSTKLEVVLHEVKRHLSIKLKKIVLVHLVRDKFSELRTNYDLFSIILRTEGVIYHENINRVSVPHEQRKTLEQVYPGSGRYFFIGPARWEDVRIIFSIKDLNALENQPIEGTADKPIVLDDSPNPKMARPPKPRNHAIPSGRRYRPGGQMKLEADDRESHVGQVDPFKAAAIRNWTRGPGHPSTGSSSESSTAASGWPCWD